MLASTIRWSITYVCTHAFISECQTLLAQFPNANTDCRQWCDSCHGRIGGPRLFCIDCTIKSTEAYDNLDFCSAPQCVAARVTRENLEGAHDPDHRLVKVRTTVMRRHHGRVHTAACDAFERVEETRRKIAENISSHPDEESGSDEQKTSFGPSSTETVDKNVKPDGGGAEIEGEPARDARLDQVQDPRLPNCGNCKGPLSFPFWYCIFCEGQSQ
jgi:hypothetical protein